MTASVNKERRKVREKIKITKAFDKSSAKSIKIQSCRQERYNLPTLYTVMTEEKKSSWTFWRVFWRESERMMVPLIELFL